MTPAKPPAERLREIVDYLPDTECADCVLQIATDIEAREKALTGLLTRFSVGKNSGLYHLEIDGQIVSRPIDRELQDLLGEIKKAMEKANV